MILRPLVLRAATIFAAAAIATISHAQSWPSRPITMIVPFPAGDATDLLARALGVDLTDKLGQQVVTDNLTGATRWP